MSAQPCNNENLPTARDIVCPWATVEALVNARLRYFKIPALSEAESFLLYIVILSLYHEGVRPTFPEVHNKLKEHNASEELLQRFVPYYLLQLEWYKVCLGANQPLPTNTEDDLSKSMESIRESEADASRTGKRASCAKRPAAALNDVIIYFRFEPAWWQGWVNVRDTTNHYSAEIWLDFLDFLRASTSDAALAGATSETLLFEHTRYALAKAIKKVGPPTLRQLRLGDIAHLIQLALQHGILCYESTTIQPCWTSHTLASVRTVALNWKAVPSATIKDVEIRLQIEANNSKHASKSCIKPQAASLGDRSTEASSTCHTGPTDEDCLLGIESPTNPQHKLINSMQELRLVLSECLQRQPAGRMLLSQLRALLEADYGLILQPLAFGYNKLSDLISDHLKDICLLTRHRSRHVFIELVADPSMRPRDTTPRAGERQHLSSLAEEHVRAIVDLWESSGCEAEEWTVEDLARLDVMMSAKNQFFPSSRRPLAPRLSMQTGHTPKPGTSSEDT